jgi:hypothetical protein
VKMKLHAFVERCLDKRTRTRRTGESVTRNTLKETKKHETRQGMRAGLGGEGGGAATAFSDRAHGVGEPEGH